MSSCPAPWPCWRTAPLDGGGGVELDASQSLRTPRSAQTITATLCPASPLYFAFSYCGMALAAMTPRDSQPPVERMKDEGGRMTKNARIRRNILFILHPSDFIPGSSAASSTPTPRWPTRHQRMTDSNGRARAHQTDEAGLPVSPIYSADPERRRRQQRRARNPIG